MADREEKVIYKVVIDASGIPSELRPGGPQQIPGSSPAASPAPTAPTLPPHLLTNTGRIYTAADLVGAARNPARMPLPLPPLPQIQRPPVAAMSAGRFPFASSLRLAGAGEAAGPMAFALRSSVGGGAGGAAIAGLAVASVVVPLKTLADSVKLANSAVGKFMRSFETGEASHALKGMISAAQATTKTVSLMAAGIAGPILSYIPNKIIGAGNGVIDALDSLTNRLGKFSPIVAAQQAQLMVSGKLLQIRMSQVFTPLMSAWQHVQMKVIDILTAMGPKLTPIVTTVSNWLNKLADALPKVVSAMLAGASGLALGFSTVTKAIAGIAAVFVPAAVSPLVKIAKTLDMISSSLENAATSAALAGKNFTAGVNLWSLSLRGLTAGMTHAPRTMAAPAAGMAPQQQQQSAAAAQNRSYFGGANTGLNAGGVTVMPQTRARDVQAPPGGGLYEKRPTTRPADPPPFHPPMRELKLQFAWTQNIKYELENFHDLHASMRDHARRLFEGMDHVVNEAQLAISTGCTKAMYGDSGAVI